MQIDDDEENRGTSSIACLLVSVVMVVLFVIWRL